MTKKESQCISGAAATDRAPTVHQALSEELPSLTLSTVSILCAYEDLVLRERQRFSPRCTGWAEAGTRSHPP